LPSTWNQKYKLSLIGCLQKIVHDNLITVFCLLNNDIITAVSSEEEQMIIPIEIKYESNN